MCYRVEQRVGLIPRAHRARQHDRANHSDGRRCTSCGKPAMETTFGGLLTLVFMWPRTFAERNLLAPMRIHAFNNRYVADVPDSLPKYESYWPRQYAIMRTVF